MCYITYKEYLTLFFFSFFRFKGVLEELRDAYPDADRTKKLHILSLSPYGIEKTMEFFGASHHMVLTARSLKKDFGILPKVPHMSKGKVVTKDMEQKVIDFFEDDSISRQMPGKKDCVSVRDKEGNRHTKQKRLVLGSLKEVFQAFKETEDHPNIGFSTFSSLRPKHCVLAGTAGTHAVCVCTYHQNPTLQLNSIGEQNLTLENVMEKAVCDIQNRSCMMRECFDCPGQQGVKDFIQGLPAMEDKDEIRYKRWVSTDRCTLQDVTESYEEFIESFSAAIIKLLRHHQVSREQSDAFRRAKDCQDDRTGVLVGDFGENYSFVVQDAAQSFHWDNSQCTLHPFVFYYRDADGSIKHQCYCFISDLTKHSTAMVHTFLRTLVPLLKETHPLIEELIYYSDGCAGQYKNRYNFINLLYHEADFGIKAQWNFFATSHGKGACDGVCGCMKRCAAKASLQRPYADQILTAADFFNYCKENFPNIQCFFTPKAAVEQVTADLEQRFSTAVTIPGTQKHHHFRPIGDGKLEISETSHSFSTRKPVPICHEGGNVPAHEDNQVEPLDFVGSYVVVADDSKLWVGFVDHRCEQFGDFFIRFLHPAGINASYSFPDNRREECFKEQSQIKGVLPAPTLSGRSRIRYAFPRENLNSLMSD